MPTPRVRRLDAHHDPIFGHGTRDYAGTAESTAQRVECFLLGIQGEAYLDTDRFIPWWQSPDSDVEPVMGGHGGLAYARSQVTAGILGIEGVASIEALTMSLDHQTRKLSIAINLITTDGDAVAISRVIG